MKAVSLFLISTMGYFANAAGPCTIDLDKQTGRYHPLIVNSTGYFIYPSDGNRLLTIADGQQISLVCHRTERRSNYVKATSVTGLHSKKPEVDLTCNSGALQLEDGTEADIKKASCTGIQEPEIIRDLQSDCSNGVGADGRNDNLEKIIGVKIGFKIKGQFHEQISLCIDEKMYGTLWTKHTIRGLSIEQRDKTPGRPSFRTDNRGYKRFFPFASSYKITKAYSKRNQVATVKKLLGTNNKLPNGETIIEQSRSGTNYFAKGHLSPDAAFIYDAEQDATYFFINVAPQFQSFNNGNWKQLEAASREYAEMTASDVTIYTGTWGILQYPNKNNEPTDIFVYVNKKNSSDVSIPVPLYYWKVLHNEETNEAVAFIGLNDPHSEDITVPFCEPVCDQLAWVDWDVDMEEKGFMTCCSVADLRAKIPFVPDLGAPTLISDLQ